MDQNSTGGSDKRNWRERLGIGTKDNGMIAKDLPKVSGEFRGTIVPEAATPVVAVPKSAVPAVRPAPMAPRPAAKPNVSAAAATTASRPSAPPVPRPAPASPDALANKLKAQRDAAEKLAEQRVAAAKQRAEAAMPGHVNGGGEKPKFSFADDESKSPAAPATRTAPQVQRPASPAPMPSNGYSNQIAPPRPPLGGGQALPPRAAPPPQQGYPQAPAYPQGQSYFPQQQPQYPSGYQPQPPQGYSPVPPPVYRPIDPATGYAPQPQYNPQSRPPFQPSAGANPPRLQVPTQRLPTSGFNSPASAFGNEVPRNLRPNVSPPIRPVAPEGDEDDIFEQPAPRATRRATADEYSQAYREVETGYEEEQPRSYTPLILLSLIGLAVVAGLLGWWGYNNYIKNGGKLSIGQSDVPVVAAPIKPAKAPPDATATDNAAAGKAANSSKKLIYDRIVGDKEVTGGQLVPSEETPVQPANNAAPANTDAKPADAVPAPSVGTGSDGTPLPLPPPPGAAPAPQGSLDPSGKADVVKAAETVITPAAGAESTAAVALPVVPGTQLSSKTTDVAATAAGSAPAGSEVIIPKVETSQPAAIVPDVKAVSEAITDTPPEPAITAADKKLSAKVMQPKKLASAEKSLGSKPIVLVPPSKSARPKNPVSAAKKLSSPPIGDSSFYGNAELGQDTQVANAEVAPVEVPKKRKTLLDLFKTDSANSSVSTPVAEAPVVLPPPTQQVAAVAPKIVAPAPVAATGAFVAQLASFKSKSEANAEYARLVAKHGEIIKRYAPIIEQASVAGSTRYRLNIGPMATSNVATSLCSSLFAAGERDCLVHKQ